MFDQIRRHKIDPRRRIRDESKQHAIPPESAIDPRLSYTPQAFEEWSFEGERILLNGEDVNELVNEQQNNIGFLAGMSHSVEDYRQHVWEHYGKEWKKFNGAAEGLQGKVLRRLGSIYDGLSSGVKCEMSDGQLWLNNVDISALIRLYRLRPTAKARAYLKGFQYKLALILSRQSSNQRYNGIRDEVARIFEELTNALQHTPTSDTPLLTAGSRPA